MVAGHDQLVEVGGLGGVERLEREVVDEQELHLGEAAHLGFDAVVQPGGLEPLEQRVGAEHEHAAAAAHGDVPERVGQVPLITTGPSRQAPWAPSRNRRLESSFHRAWS